MRFGSGFFFVMVLAVIVFIARSLGINVSQGFYLIMIAVYVIGLFGWNFNKSYKNNKADQ